MGRDVRELALSFLHELLINVLTIGGSGCIQRRRMWELLNKGGGPIPGRAGVGVEHNMFFLE